MISETCVFGSSSLADIDYLDPPSSANNKSAAVTKIAVLTHGLESSSDAPLTSKMAFAFAARGFHVAVLCFRSCSVGADGNTQDNLTLKYVRTCP